MRRATPKLASVTSNESSVMKLPPKSTSRSDGDDTTAVEDILPSTTGQTKKVEGVGGFVPGLPFTTAKSAVDAGLKKIFDAVPGGPTGGVVWFRAGKIERGALSNTVSPFLWSVEKQVTPPAEPPFNAQATVN